MTGEPTTVEIDIEVRSMGQISEMDMLSHPPQSFSMDCYFRQSWVDDRLTFSHLDDDLTLSLAVLDKLWKPDTFIYNGKKSYVHLITTPNKFVRLYRNGRILYSSSRVHNPRRGVQVENADRQVVIAPDLMLSQFDLIATPSGFENTTRRAGFYLQRHMGNFLIQVYGPCILLVVLSWVSFWLNREATSDRISLGITTVLTMTFLGLEARTDLPKVSYSTALDLFVWISYGFIFATIIEFAFVHLFTKVGSGEVYLSEACSEAGSEDEGDDDREQQIGEYDDEDEEEEEPDTEPIAACTVMHLAARERQNYDLSEPNNLINLGKCAIHSTARAPYLSPPWSSRVPTAAAAPTTTTTVSWINNTPSQSSTSTSVQLSSRSPSAWCSSLHRPWWACKPELPGDLPPPALRPTHITTNTTTARRVQKESQQQRQREQQQQQPPQQQEPRVKQQVNNRLTQMNSVSYIDEVSRVLFPLSFLCINLLYWYTYLASTS
ncbi:hypothetical protein Pcinc_039679 [Petrolisthes cinctipes]|uniref:Uncharacterized protein n=1 Tax=Petrolisthes cinctipes TaxID=88211 RepID=A0AAE1EIU9_PETCI|nr:hypothetical protein Pcinc_039679 [Petrolisthes cinctipes]